MKQFSTHDLSWAPKSPHKHSCALMSTQKHSWVWCYGAMNAHECWWALIGSWRHAYDCSWALLSAHCSMVPSSWLLMAAHECSMVIRNTQSCSWLLMSAHEGLWGLMGAHKCSWLLISSTHEKPWAWHHGAMSTHESSRADMSMVPWGYER